MSEWKKVKLREVLKEVNERNKDEKVKRVLSVTNSQGFVNQEDYFEGTIHSANISNYKIVRNNQFAYNPSRVNVGSIDILQDYEEGALSPMYVVFEVDTTKLLPEYFKYYFQTNRFYENVKNNTQGSVRNSLSFNALSDFEYLLPPIGEQEKIVKILKNIDSIIEKYESLLEEKNQFIKSQFVEMFGNNECIEKKKIINICKSIVRGPFGSALKKEFFVPKGENTYKVYEQKNAINEDSSLGTYYIDENKFNELKRFECKPGDIIMSCSGTIGKIYQLPNDIEKGVINQALLKFTLDYSKVLPIYFLEFIKSNIQNLETKGTGLQNLGSVSYIKEMGIPVPTMEQQKQFVELGEQIDKQKFLLEKQKQNYENLKEGLMQQLLTGKVRVKQ